MQSAINYYIAQAKEDIKLLSKSVKGLFSKNRWDTDDLSSNSDLDRDLNIEEIHIAEDTSKASYESTNKYENFQSRIESVGQKVFKETNINTLNKKIKESKTKSKAIIKDSIILTDYLPYSSYSPKTNLFSSAQTMGFILRLSHLSGMDESAKSALTNLIGELPSNFTLQIINFASPKIGNIVDKWFGSTKANDVFDKLANHRRDYLNSGAWETLIGDKGNLLVRDYELYLQISAPVGRGEVENQIIEYELVALLEKIKQGLKNLGSDNYVLDDNDLIDLLKDIIEPSDNLYKNRNSKAENDNYSKGIFYQKLDKSLSCNDLIIHKDRAVFSVKEKRSSINLPLIEEKDDTKSKQDNNKLNDQAKSSSSNKPIKSNSEYNYTVWEVVEWPEAWSIHNSVDYMGDFIRATSIPCPWYISYGFTLTSRDESERLANNHRLLKTKQGDSKLPMFFPKMIEEIEDWRQVSERIDRGERLGKTVMFIVLCAKDMRQLKKSETILREHFARLNFKIEKVYFDILNNIITSLPFGIGESWKKLSQTKVPSKKLSGACTNLLPAFSDAQNYSDPMLILLGRRGQLFYFNNFKAGNNQNGNFNITIAGASGRGKSVLLQEYAVSILREGGQVVIIDDGRSFKNTCEILEGDFVDFGGGEFCINPFSLYRKPTSAEDISEYREYFEEPFIDLIVSILCVIINLDKNNNSDPEIGLYRTILASATAQVIADYGSSGGFEHIREELISKSEHIKNVETKTIIDKIEYSLKRYARGGRYYKYFNGKSTLNIENKLTIFELSDLEHNEILQNATMLTIVFLVYSKIQQRNRQTALIIDEFWRTGKHPALKGPIGGFARRGRKYNLALIVASQCMSDYSVENSEAGAQALSQSDWRILLSVDGKDTEILKNELGMSSSEIEIAKGLSGMRGAYSEFMIRHKEGNWQIARLILDPWSVQLYSSKAEDVAQIKHMRKNGISIADAIETLVLSKGENV